MPETRRASTVRQNRLDVKTLTTKVYGIGGHDFAHAIMLPQRNTAWHCLPTLCRSLLGKQNFDT